MDTSDNEFNTASMVVTDFTSESGIGDLAPGLGNLSTGLLTLPNLLNRHLRPRRRYQPIYPSWMTTNIVRPVQQWMPPPLTLPGSTTTTEDAHLTLPLLSTANNIITRSFNDENKYKEVISDKGLECIKTVIFDPEKFRDIPCCVITREKFEMGEKISQLPCGHIFKKEPIETWLKQGGPTCPVCRHKFDSKEIKKEIPSMLSTTDSSGNNLSNRNYITNFRIMLRNMIDERINEEEEYDVQRAILASLRGQHGDDDEEQQFTAAPAPLPPPPPPAPLPSPPSHIISLPSNDSPEETISDDNLSTDSETF